MEMTDSEIQIDHKDRNKKNNRKYNLRPCTNEQNACNKDTIKNNKSGFRGVFFKTDKNKWQVKIRQKFIKYCDSYEEAVQVRLQAEKEYFGDFRPE